MVFSSLVFLCVFLPVVFILYWLIPSLTIQNGLLIVASLLFYAYGEPVYILLMLFSIFTNYIFGRLLDTDRQNTRKFILWISVIVNIGLLVVFKYADMIVGWVNTFGLSIQQPNISLPIGISFFTFQALSYVVDVYRKHVQPQKNVFHVMLYISFFPQLIAGPIVRYIDIENQIEHREKNPQEMAYGIRRFIVGLSKKVLISNSLALCVDTLYHVFNFNIVSAWIFGISYMFQIYFDFSGYSDMAIGLGHMFGFSFKENFKYPYISSSIKEFWRRWHISLSTWFKEYLYIPLGGNRKGKTRTSINKAIVFMATGIWHGANLTFLMWGIWHGFFMLLEERVDVKKMPKVLQHIYTLLVVCIGFVVFRADTIMEGLLIVKTMFIGFNFSSSNMIVLLNACKPMMILVWICAIIGSTPICKERMEIVLASKHGELLSFVGSIGLLLICLLVLSGGSYNPFIYFRF